MMVPGQGQDPTNDNAPAQPQPSQTDFWLALATMHRNGAFDQGMEEAQKKQQTFDDLIGREPLSSKDRQEYYDDNQTEKDREREKQEGKPDADELKSYGREMQRQQNLPAKPEIISKRKRQDI